MKPKEKKTVTKMTLDYFEGFVLRYRKKYGSNNLTDEQVTIFYNKCHHLSIEDFQIVTDDLFKSFNWCFDFVKILERAQILFPSTVNNIAIEREWELEHDKSSNSDVKQKMSQLLSAIPQLVELNPTGWRIDYFKKHVALLGIEASTKIAQDIKNQFPEFNEWIKKGYGNQGIYEETI